MNSLAFWEIVLCVLFFETLGEKLCIFFSEIHFTVKTTKSIKKRFYATGDCILMTNISIIYVDLSIAPKSTFLKSI